jgi:hypothetical protein
MPEVTGTNNHDYPQNRDGMRVVQLMARAIGNYQRHLKVNPHDMEIAVRVHRTLTAEGWAIVRMSDYEPLDGEDEEAAL